MREGTRRRAGAGRLALGCAAAVALLLPGGAGAATVTVNSSADDGTNCTLRDAIVSTNADSDEPGCTHTGSYATGGADIVDVPASAGPVIQLASQLAIDQTTGVLGIDGPGVDQLDVRGGATFRVISITGGGGSAGPTTIEGLTVSHGTAVNSTGGGISETSFGTQALGLFNAAVVGNTSTQTTTDGSAGAGGGGIYTERALTLDNTTVAGNHATAVTSGGAMFNYSIALGGGIESSAAATTTITGSTISGNDATATASGNGPNAQAYGGAISESSGGSWDIKNSTISGNTASAADAAIGGGLSTGAAGGTTLTHVTITGNSASSGANVFRGGPADTFRGTIVSNPQVGTNCNALGTSGGFNIEDDATCFTLNGTNDQQTNPMIESTLAFNGGLTKTHALQPLSPAIDKGAAFSTTADQRGFNRIFNFPAIMPASGGGDDSDVGAFEYTDPDLDGVESGHDNCPADANVGQANHDADSLGDACDTDDDNDGKDDGSDSCATGDTGWTSNGTTDHDSDGCRDAGEDTDDDNDTRADGSDSCAAGETGWTSSNTTDVDADGCRDAGEDTDDDNDGVADGSDACPTVAGTGPNGCAPVPVVPLLAPTTPAAGPTGQRAAALKKCKKKKGAARKRCKKKALKLPV